MEFQRGLRASLVKHLPRALRRFRSRTAQHMKRASLRMRRRFLVSLLALSCASAWHNTGWAQLPSGGEVVAGSASILHSGGAMNIQSHTDRAVINWQDFSVAHGSSVNFAMPDATSAVLNRVISEGTPSIIAGSITSNGNVYLANPSGVIVGPTGAINTNGFTATTHDIATSEFMKGGDLTLSGQSSAAIINKGTIHTGAGGANLIANDVINEGMITSQGGSINLATGGQVTLSNGATYTQADVKTIANGISETAGLIKNSGELRATGALAVGGKVYLVNPGGKIINDGAIMAQRSTSGATGAMASATVGGKVAIEAKETELKTGSTIDASGTHGGGEVLVGGGWQGSGMMSQANRVTMEQGATIDVSATVQGDGGTAVLWSDVDDSTSMTSAHGTILAKGGASGGDGGRIETSSHRVSVSGLIANASSLLGKAGQWLLDPYSLTVVSFSTDASTSNGDPYQFSADSGGGDVDAADIEAQLNNGTSVVLQTTGTDGDGNGAGSITVDAAISKTSGGDATLSLLAHGSIFINQAITSTAGKLNVILNADSDSSGSGMIDMAADILSNGGNIIAGGMSNPSGQRATAEVGANNGVVVNTGVTLNAAGGNIKINGKGPANTDRMTYGVVIAENSTVTTNGSGTIQISGVAEGLKDMNIGVGIFQNAHVSTQNGTIDISGYGGGSNATAAIDLHENMGLAVVQGAQISSSGGLITLYGTGGYGENAFGVYLDLGAQLTNSNSGGVRVFGTSGSDSRNLNAGIYSHADITTSSGGILLSGTSTATSGTDGYGVYVLNGDLASTSGWIVLNGTSNATSGTGNGGVYVYDNATLSTTYGSIQVTGTSDASATDISIDGSLTTGNEFSSIDLTADSLVIDTTNGSVASITASNHGTVNILNRTAGRNIDIGAAGANPGLVIDNAELARINAVNINFGNQTDLAGDISVNAAWTQPTATYVNMLAGNDVNVNSNFTLSDAGTINLMANRNVSVGNSVTITAPNPVEIFLNSDRDSDSDGAIELKTNSSLISNGGYITLGGGSSPGTQSAFGNSSLSHGITLNNYVTINAGGGNISLRGTGNASGGSAFGIALGPDTLITTSGTGTINLVGVGGGSSLASGSNEYGIYMGSGAQVESGSTGLVYLEGHGGGYSGNATGTSNYGILMTNASQSPTRVRNTVGSVQVIGYGGSGTADNSGVVLNDAMTSIGAMDQGNATITGYSGTGAADTSTALYLGGTVFTASGYVTLEGYTTGNTGAGTRGIDQNANGVITTTDGGISITGEGGVDASGVNLSGSIASTWGSVNITASNAAGSTSAHQLVIGGSIETGGDIVFTTDSIDIGTGAGVTTVTDEITIKQRSNNTGFRIGGSDVLGASSHTIGLSQAEINRINTHYLTLGKRQTSSGDMSFLGNVDFSAIDHVTFLSGLDIDIGSQVKGANNGSVEFYADRNISVQNNTSLFSAANPLDVILYSNNLHNGGVVRFGTNAAVTTHGGNITIGGGSSTLADAAESIGSYLNAVEIGSGTTLDAGGGNIAVRGYASQSGSGTSAGVLIDGATIKTNGNGEILILGANSSSTDSGIGTRIINGSQIVGSNRTSTAAVQINGYGGSGTSDNIGVVIAGTNTQVSTTGGHIAITGSGGQSSASNNTGVYLQSDALISTTNAGNITITGSSIASGDQAGGAVIDGNIQTSSGTIQLSGTASTASGADNHGLIVNGNIDSTSGNIVVLATGGRTNTGSEGFVLNGKLQTNHANSFIKVHTDSLDLNTSTGALKALGGKLYVSGRNSGDAIDLGGADVLGNSSRKIGISNNELNRMWADSLWIGNSAFLSGDISMTADIEPLHVNSLTLASAGNINAQNEFFISDGMSLNLLAGGNILFDNAGISPTLSGTPGAFSVLLDSDYDDDSSGFIQLINNSVIQNVGGSITLSGGSDPLADWAANSTQGEAGIYLDHSALYSDGGNITLRGHSSSSTGSDNAGVVLSNSSINGGHAGQINILGVGGGDLDTNYGVILMATSINVGELESLDIHGTAGGANAGTNNIGVSIDGNSNIMSSGGAVSVYGIGGGGSGSGNSGIFNAGALITQGDSVLFWGLKGSESTTGSFGIVNTGGMVPIGSSPTVTLKADTFEITGGFISAGVEGTIVIDGVSPGTRIHIDNNDDQDGGSTIASLSATELSSLYAKNLIIGSNTTGSIDVNVGLSPSMVGNVTLRSAGNITFAENVSLLNSGNFIAKALSTITIDATKHIATANGDIDLSGARILNNAGSNALSAGGTGKVWRVWSTNGSPFDGATPDDFGGLDYDYKQYAAMYEFNPAVGTGNGVLYNIAPTVDLQFNAYVSKTYDGTNVAYIDGNSFNGTFNLYDGDTIVFANGTYDDPNAGYVKTVTIAPITQVENNGRPVYGVDITLDSTTNTNAGIDPLQLTNSPVSGITASNKTYDGNTDAVLDFTGAIIAGKINGDTLTISGGTGAFVDKNAGPNKTVNITQLVLGGASAGNYVLVDDTATTTATIDPRHITSISGITAADKQYNTSTHATLDTSSAVLHGMLVGDDLNVASAIGNFVNKNAGLNKLVNITGLTLGGSDVGNYTLDSAIASAIASISKADITSISGVTAIDKTYDRSTNAPLDLSSAVLTGILGGDDVTLSGAVGTFADKNAGLGKQVVINGFTLGGVDANNYTLNGISLIDFADILRAPISQITDITVLDKNYDGTTDAELDLTTAQFAGKVAGDQLTVAAGHGEFTDAEVGLLKTVHIVGLALGGADSDNYDLLQTFATTLASITTVDELVNFAQQQIAFDGFGRHNPNNPTNPATTLNSLSSSMNSTAGLSTMLGGSTSTAGQVLVAQVDEDSSESIDNGQTTQRKKKRVYIGTQNVDESELD